MIIYLANITGVNVTDIPAEKLSRRTQIKFERLKGGAPLKAVQTAVADLVLAHAKKVENIVSDIAENEHGKPYFNTSEKRFSITHSDNIVAVSLSDNNHGIDIERLRHMDEKTVRAVLSPYSYLEYLKADDAEKDKMFVRIFTEKESYVKYLGTGFECKPSEIVPQNVSFLTKYLFRDADVYCLTVCVEKQETFTFEPLSVKDLLASNL